MRKSSKIYPNRGSSHSSFSRDSSSKHSTGSKKSRQSDCETVVSYNGNEILAVSKQKKGRNEFGKCLVDWMVYLFARCGCFLLFCRLRNQSGELRVEKICYYFTLPCLLFFSFTLIFLESFWSSNYVNAISFFIYFCLFCCAIPLFWILQLETIINCFLQGYLIFSSLINVFLTPYIVSDSPRGIFNNVHVILMFLIPTIAISFQNSLVIKIVFFTVFCVLVSSSFAVDMILNSQKSNTDTRFDFIVFYSLPFFFVCMIFFSKLKLYRNPKHAMKKKELKDLRFIRDLIVYMKIESKELDDLLRKPDNKSTKKENLIKDIVFHLREYRSYLPSHLFDEVHVTALDSKKSGKSINGNNKKKKKALTSADSSDTLNSSDDSSSDNSADYKKNGVGRQSMRSISSVSTGDSSEDYGNSRNAIRRARSDGSVSSTGSASGCNDDDSERYLSIQNSGLDITQNDQTLVMVKIEGFDIHLQNLRTEDFLFFHTSIVSSFQSTLEKYGGYMHTIYNDVIYASFNSPVRIIVQHEKTAVKASLEILETCRSRLGKMFRRMNIPPPRVTIGVYSGYIHVGNLGCDKMRRYIHVGRAMRILSGMVDVGRKYGRRLVVNGQAWGKAKFNFEGRRLDLAVFGGNSMSGSGIARASSSSLKMNINRNDSSKSVESLETVESSSPSLADIPKVSSLTNFSNSEVVSELFFVKRKKKKKKKKRNKKSGSGDLKNNKQNEWYDECGIGLQEETDEDRFEKIWVCYLRGDHERGLELVEELKSRFSSENIPKELLNICNRMESGKTLAIQLENVLDLVDISDIYGKL